jgi:hypothetical protein
VRATSMNTWMQRSLSMRVSGRFQIRNNEFRRDSNAGQPGLPTMP